MKMAYGGVLTWGGCDGLVFWAAHEVAFDGSCLASRYSSHARWGWNDAVGRRFEEDEVDMDEVSVCPVRKVVRGGDMTDRLLVE